MRQDDTTMMALIGIALAAGAGIAYAAKKVYDYENS